MIPRHLWLKRKGYQKIDILYNENFWGLNFSIQRKLYFLFLHQQHLVKSKQLLPMPQGLKKIRIMLPTLLLKAIDTPFG